MCVNDFFILMKRFKKCFYEQILYTHQPIAKDRQRTYNQSGSGPWAPTASRWDLTSAYNPQRWIPVKLSHIVINKLKKWSKLHPPEPFFALFFAGTTCEELHSRAAAKSTSSSRTTPGIERMTMSAVSESISNTRTLSRKVCLSVYLRN